MTDQEAVIALATKTFGWKQDGDFHSVKFRTDDGTIATFIPDHESGDAGIIIDKMNRLGFTTFHYEPNGAGRWKAYFGKPEWEVIAGPTWKHALVRATLKAFSERAAEQKAKQQ
jgi:hypothetical protein